MWHDSVGDATGLENCQHSHGRSLCSGGWLSAGQAAVRADRRARLRQQRHPARRARSSLPARAPCAALCPDTARSRRWPPLHGSGRAQPAPIEWPQRPGACRRARPRQEAVPHRPQPCSAGRGGARALPPALTVRHEGRGLLVEQRLLQGGGCQRLGAQELHAAGGREGACGWVRSLWCTASKQRHARERGGHQREGKAGRQDVGHVRMPRRAGREGAGAKQGTGAGGARFPRGAAADALTTRCTPPAPRSTAAW